MSRDANAEEVDRLREENEELRRKVKVFEAEHRIFAWSAGALFLGPRLAESIRRWLEKATPANPLPIEETAALVASVIRRVVRAGLIGLIITNGILIWQNLLIRSQNRYFREQTGELRRQIEIQEEQGELVNRSQLIDLIYEGKDKNLKPRTRAEALKAFVALERRIIEREGRRKDHWSRTYAPLVNLRKIDFSCSHPGGPECADLRNLDLRKIDLRGAQLRGALLDGADLSESMLQLADLSGASLENSDLRGTSFRNFIGLDDVGRIYYTKDDGYSEFERRHPLSVSVAQFAYRKGLKGRGPHFFGFALERSGLSRDMVAYLNQLSSAANMAESKISTFKIDDDTKITFGILQPRSRSFLVHYWLSLKKFDVFSARASQIYGLGRVNLKTSFGPPSSIHMECVPGTSAVITLNPGNLNEIINMKQPEIDELIHSLCGDDGED